MRISWVVADDTFLPPDIDINQLRDIGPIWGGWKTWRNCGTDNVICNDPEKARDLVIRGFQKNCNFYLPKSLFVDIGRPDGVRLFDGKFKFEVEKQDELISMHLASSSSDVVLLLGFNWKDQPKISDRYQEHLAQNYRNTVKHAIKDNAAVQWVLVDHPDGLMTELNELDNLTQDSLANVLEILSA